MGYYPVVIGCAATAAAFCWPALALPIAAGAAVTGVAVSIFKEDPTKENQNSKLPKRNYGPLIIAGAAVFAGSLIAAASACTGLGSWVCTASKIGVVVGGLITAGSFVKFVHS